MKNNQLFYNHSLSHKIAEKITNQIMSGELKPGEKIIESTYAEEFGTSRAPIRESLYLLENEGLIERIPRKGAIVKGYTEDEVYDLLEMRVVLESLAMKRIKIRGVNEETLRKMEQLVQQMEEVDGDEKLYASLNQEFHMQIIEMSGSEIIKEMYWRLGRPLLVLQRISFLEKEHIKKSLKEHRIILDLLKENLIDEALVLLENHNHSVIKRVKTKL